MFRSHLALMIIFAACVSAVFAVLMREGVRDQLVLAGQMLGALIVVALVLGWLMLPFPI